MDILSKEKRLTLARLLRLYSEVVTDEGYLLVSEDELAVGEEVYTVADGVTVPAADGEYKYDGKSITVEGGVVTAIVEEPAPEEPAEELAEEPAEESAEELAEELAEEEPAEEPAEDTDERDARIAELEDAVAGRDNRIAELEAQLEELKAKLAEAEEPAEEPAEEKFKSADNGADRAMNIIRALKKK